MLTWPLFAYFGLNVLHAIGRDRRGTTPPAYASRSGTSRVADFCLVALRTPNDTR